MYNSVLPGNRRVFFSREPRPKPYFASLPGPVPLTAICPVLKIAVHLAPPDCSGVCVEKQPLLMIMEYMARGDLKGVLMDSRPEVGCTGLSGAGRQIRGFMSRCAGCVPHG